MSQAYFVYKLTSPNTPKEYIGMTQNPKRRLEDHRKKARHGATTALYYAMRKYGVPSFEMTILKEVNSKEEAFEWEKLIIVEQNTLLSRK